MLENLTDEQFKAVVVFVLFILPTILSSVVYFISEKVEKVIRRRRRGDNQCLKCGKTKKKHYNSQ